MAINQTENNVDIVENDIDGVVENNVDVVENNVDVVKNDIDMKKQLARERSRIWRQNNRQKNTDYRRNYYQKNIEQLREYSNTYMKDYYAKNDDKRLLHNQRVLATRNNLSEDERTQNKLKRKVKKYENDIQITTNKYEEAKNQLINFNSDVYVDDVDM